MVISNNLLAMNANRQYGMVTKSKVKATEKLSSGYKINRAADDAAGLAISEKMRRLIRGLEQGTENAEDGVSWTQIGDGALNEAHDIIHRMTTLAVKALNGTNTDSDRMYIEEEFEALQSELDRISTTTTFNEIPIFDQHEYPYYQCEGSIAWDPQQKHVVTAGENDLTFEYRAKEGEPLQTMTISVPAGEYTTQELVDEIDTAICEKNMTEPKLVLEFTESGFCNANIESGEKLDSVSGGLSYLLYHTYKGGSFGALIGTTSFPTEYSRLEVVSGQNDSMSFSIESFSGGTQNKSITIPQGKYNRSELIDLLNAQLADTSVRATAYGDGIKLASEEALVTGFKGNMFKIDGSGSVYNSVFYDNVKYGSVSQEPAVFQGGYVLPTDSRDEEHKYYRIDSSNNTLTLQPNQADAPTTITIPEGEYTADTMVAKLNELFSGKVDVTATKITSGGFCGIKLTSGLEGPDSAINLDVNSTAYDTLFVNREYNQYGGKRYPVNENSADKEAVFTGSKDLASLTTTPLTITAGVNDSFKLSLTSGGTTSEYTIKLSAKTYNSVSELQAEIDNQLNGSNALAGYKDKIVLSTSADKLVLTGKDGAAIDKIRVSADGSNNGFDDIFQGYRTQVSQQTATGTGSVTLNTPFTGKIDNSDSSLNIKVDNQNYTVQLPTGDNVSQQDVINAIQTTIPGREERIPNTFSSVSATGGNGDQNFSRTATGTETSVSWHDSDQGSSTTQEGFVGTGNNVPAKLTIGPALQSSMKVTSANNEITLTLNDTTKTLTLAEGTYTPDSLKNALQQAINDNFGDGSASGFGRATVSVSGNQLTLTSVLPEGADGEDTYIACNTSTSSFLKELNTTRTPAVWKSNTMASGITIDDSNQTFSFTYKENGVSENVNLTLAKGTYSQSTIVNEINNQLRNAGKNVTASLESGCLKLITAETGTGAGITYNTRTGGSSAEAIFGPLNNPSPAQILVNKKTEDSIKIEQGVSDSFSITVDGVKETVTLDAGTYNRTQFATMLNQKLATKGVEAYVSGDKIGYRTVDKGSEASLVMSYADGGTSMKSIYGETVTEYPGVTASFDSNGKLVLNTEPGHTITVGSSNGGAFQEPTVTQVPISTTYTDGYHSTKKSYINGVSLSGNITIDEWNNNLNFNYEKDNANQIVSIEIPQKEYTQDELAAQLQSLLDDKVGSNQIVVTVTSSGVKLEAVNTGSRYGFSNFSGDFYDKVICSCTEKSIDQTPRNTDGSQRVDSAYTVGRKDVRNSVIDIRNGISDELSLDLTYGNQTHTIQMKLDAGKYSGDAMVQHIQEKLNEQLKLMNLPENLIEAKIGGVNTGVYGANDSNAINFSLSKTVQAPDEGQFIIDGVKGSAAFEIFYQTEGRNEPAYVMGNKDVSEGVVIGPDETELAFTVDGTDYSITIPEGEYTTEEIRDVMNEKLAAANAPVVAEISGNNFKLSHKKLGSHEIDKLSGGAKKKIFFNEHGETKEPAGRYVQLSSESGDSIGLNRHIFNSVSLGLNSCCLSKTKNAEKALTRLKGALEYISNIRSDFGSTQNRLEHAINNNENKHENLQSAESVIRDTDMAEEMMKLSKFNILHQAGQAMIVQANQIPEGVLGLLR